MENLKIQFSHPVHGKAQLRNKSIAHKVKILNFKSDEDFTVSINIDGLIDGDWTASLEWNHDNEPFLVEKYFKILNKELIQQKTT